MKKIKFTIITPTYNRTSIGYPGECVRSVQNQTPGNYIYEHIIVDDGSIDNTREFFLEEAKKDNRIKYCYQKNAGPAKAQQLGISKATGDYIILLDDDDLLTPNSLFDRTEYINNNPDIDWFFGLAKWIDEYGLPTEQLYQSSDYKDFLYERELISNFIHGGTTTIKRNALEMIKWPDWLIRSQDYFLWLELMRPEKKLKSGFLDTYLYLYRYYGGSYTANIDEGNKKEEKDRLNLKIKHLHPKEYVFFAEETYQYSKELKKLQDYYLEQIRNLENRAFLAEEKNKYFKISRIIGTAIITRDLLRIIQRKTISAVINIRVKLVTLIPRSIKDFVKSSLYRKKERIVCVNKQKWNDKKPLISVITPFYNRSDTMPETIRSVLNQTFQNFEYFIVNDGSTEKESIEYLREIKHPKIRIINQKNQGTAVARNRGIKETKGKYILCLDSDDIIGPTYLEKALVILESDPNISVVSPDMEMFGVVERDYVFPNYRPIDLINNNSLSTASVFLKEAWSKAGGYKSKIGYEDWEFGVNITEKGYFGKQISERLLKYRTAQDSRYMDDIKKHHDNVGLIKKIHPNYKNNVRKILRRRIYNRYESSACFNNLKSTEFYKADNGMPNILMLMPWMTFGGAETLIYNFSKAIMNQYNIHYITGLRSINEWEYKFKEITPNIYHLANLFNDKEMYLEFISNYIKTRNIKILHIIHTNFVFEFLDEIIKRHPKLKIIVTMFNDRVEYFDQSIEYKKLVDRYASDNLFVANSYKNNGIDKSKIRIIPNGIDCNEIFNVKLFDIQAEKKTLGVSGKDLSVFFIGRLSEEKNPDKFIEIAKNIIEKIDNIKFYIIGDGPMKEYVEENLKKMNSENIKYLGYQKDVAKYLAIADIFVLPSAVEGFPLSIIEAMASEAIVIASRVGAVPDVIEDNRNGFIVSPGNVDEIVDCILRINKNRNIIRVMTISARKDVEEKYSNTILGKNYTKLYRELL